MGVIESDAQRGGGQQLGGAPQWLDRSQDVEGRSRSGDDGLHEPNRMSLEGHGEGSHHIYSDNDEDDEDDDAREIFDAINERYGGNSEPSTAPPHKPQGKIRKSRRITQRRQTHIDRMAKKSGAGAVAASEPDDRMEAKMRGSGHQLIVGGKRLEGAARQQRRHDELQDSIKRDVANESKAALAANETARYARKMEGDTGVQSTTKASKTVSGATTVGAVSVPARSKEKMKRDGDVSSRERWINEMLDESGDSQPTEEKKITINRRSNDKSNDRDDLAKKKNGDHSPPVFVDAATSSLRMIQMNRSGSSGKDSESSVGKATPTAALSPSMASPQDDPASASNSRVDEQTISAIDASTHVATSTEEAPVHSHDVDLSTDGNATQDQLATPEMMEADVVAVAAQTVEDSRLESLEEFRHRIRSEFNEERERMTNEIRRDVQRDIFTNVVSGEVIKEDNAANDNGDVDGDRDVPLGNADGDGSKLPGESGRRSEQEDLDARIAEAMSSKKKKNRMIIAGLVCLLVAIAGGVAGVFATQSSGGGGGGSSSNPGTTDPPQQQPLVTQLPSAVPSKLPTLVPSVSPTAFPRLNLPTGPPIEEIKIEDFMRDLAVNISGAKALDELTPQYKAWTWVAEMDNEYPSNFDEEFLTDRYALTVMYYALDGLSWGSNFNFLQGLHICDWNDVNPEADSATYGFVCESNKQSRRFIMNSNNVGGYIPTEIFLLDLLVIELDSNQVGSAIPDGWEQMSNLQRLSLANNNITGAIPTGISGLNELRSIDLSGNELNGHIPAFSSANTVLESVSLQQQDCGVLYGNIETILDSIQGDRLREFNAGCVDFNGTLPSAAFARFRNLDTFVVTDSRIHGIVPTEMASLPNLEHLVLTNNNLSGPIPPNMANIALLEDFRIANNRMTGTIAARFNLLPALVRFEIQGNSFNGTLPAFSGSSDTLEILHVQDEIDDNDFEWRMSAFFGAAARPKLESIRCNSCRLQGSFSTSFAKLPNLQVLHLTNEAGDGLGGSIPADIAVSQDLTEIHLSGNSLSNQIPAELGSLPVLTELKLDGNDFTGLIPQEVALLSSLNVLELQHNPNLGGDLTTPICNNTDLQASLRFSQLSADCGISNRVACSCCDECF